MNRRTFFAACCAIPFLRSAQQLLRKRLRFRIAPWRHCDAPQARLLELYLNRGANRAGKAFVAAYEMVQMATKGAHR